MLRGFSWSKKYKKSKLTGGGALQCDGSSGSCCSWVFDSGQPVEKETVITTVKKLRRTEIEKGLIIDIL